MSLRFIDGHGYCDFDRADYKYLIVPNSFVPQARSGFWNPAAPNGGPGGPIAGVRTGQVDYGPFPGTQSLHMQSTTGIWYRSIDLGLPVLSDVVISMWIYPIHITAARSIVLFQRTDNPPNMLTTAGIQIRPDGRLQIGRNNQSNANFFPASFDQLLNFPHFPGPAGPNALAVSNAILPMNSSPPPLPDPTVDPTTVGWTHVCLVLHFDAGISSGRLKLFINGCADIASGGLQLLGGANLITPVWYNPGVTTDELCLSQFCVADGTDNLSQFLRIDTTFPAGNVELNWGGGGFATVNGNPGPGSSFLQLGSLSAPDELFSVAPATSSAEVLAIATGHCLEAATQDAVPLIKISGTKYVGALLGRIPGPWTRQQLFPVNPATVAPWTAADVNAAAWGIRGVGGTGEKLYQLFVEIASQAGPAKCGTASYSY